MAPRIIGQTYLLLLLIPLRKAKELFQNNYCMNSQWHNFKPIIYISANFLEISLEGSVLYIIFWAVIKILYLKQENMQE